MRFAAKTSGLLDAGSSHRGAVFAFDADGHALVRAPGLAAPVSCDVLDTGLGPIELRVGDSVAFTLYADEPGHGCVIGRICLPGDDRSRSVHLELDELTIHARSRVCIQTGRARILLAKDGTLELLAWTLVSKARRLQKLLAPMLRLN
jgi:hypothetical protein